MKDNSDAESGPLNNGHGHATPPGGQSNGPARTSGAAAPRNHLNGEKPDGKISFWFLLDVLLQRWWWMAAGAVICGTLATLLGVRVVHPRFTATAQLLRYDSPGQSDMLKSATPMSSDTFAGLIISPDLLRTIGEKATPPIPPEKLVKQIKVDPDSDSDLVNVALAAPSREEAVSLLNAYLEGAVEFTRKLQADQIGQIARTYLTREVSQMDHDIAALDAEFSRLSVPSEISNQLAQVGGQINALGRNLATGPAASPQVKLRTERLDKAVDDLSELLAKYTEAHPLVQEKQAEIQALQTEIAIDSTNALLRPAVAPTPVPAAPAFTPQLDIIRGKLLSLEEGRVQLVNRQREAELYAANPPGIVRIFAPATMTTVKGNLHRVKIGVLGLVGTIFGLCGGMGLILLVEFADGRLRTAEDTRRVTGLPVLGTLGDLERMGDEARSQWAFRTWTMLQGRLSPTADHGLICGVTSSAGGEGRSTWIRLLAEAASLTGFRVLTIATRPTPAEGMVAAENGQEPATPPLEITDPSTNLSTLARQALNSPAQVADQFDGPNPQPVVHIPLPGWVWNLERRKQWRNALNCWRQIDNLVILVELPPASEAETVLLGASLPNLVWLSDSRTARAADCRTQLDTLRHARCNLVGAVLNHESAAPLKTRFPRWIGCVGLLAALGTFRADAQDSNTMPVAAMPPAVSTNESTMPDSIESTNRSFSIVHPWQRAAWQEHLTLGPGDVLDLGLYGQPELNMLDIAIGPDGRLGYLEAQDIMAAGLTIDELRDRLDQELGKYRRAPHTLITPVAFRSKKYFMLGKVLGQGVYTLDRPLTVLEAIARARGFENGLVDGNVVDLADFSRSFIARQGKRIPLNFEKLFEGGDLSQNIPIEPGDYIYFAAAGVQEVYVVGEVRLPGPVNYASGQSVIRAITSRGGFSDRAYKSHVLVIRGSLNHPETFAVDTKAILAGGTNDFTLRPKDIIYVSSRPFVRVEELADLATTAFIQSLITSWVGVKVLPPFNQ